MTREEYLGKHWVPYPLVPGKALTPFEVQELTQKEEGLAEKPGRLPEEPGRWTGASKDSARAAHSDSEGVDQDYWVMGRWRTDLSGLELDGETFHLPEEGHPITGFERLLWRDGDWLAVSVKEPRVCLLLAPCQGPLQTPQSLKLADQFALFRGQVADFFRSQGFWQVDTPSLVLCPGTEVYVDPFTVQGRQQSFYLPTSPEIHLKKALAQGRSKAFEIAKVYRAEEKTAHHRNEFWMLEWYRVQAKTSDLVRDFVDLLEHLGRPAPALKYVTMAELFKEHLNENLTPTTSSDDLRSWCKSKGISTDRSDSYSDLFHRLYVDHIEPKLAGGSIVVVSEYPPKLAAYARLLESGWAGRTEIFWHGLEIANGFFEVCSPQEQLRRMAEDNAAKKERGAQPVGLDPDFILHLQQGYPASAGMALGLERLFMALQELSDIQKIKSF